MRGLKVRGAGEAAGNGRRREGGARLTRLEVGEGPDGRVPPVSDRRKNKREGGGAGPAGEGRLGQLGPSARARKEKEKASGLGCLRAEFGPAREMRERERGRKGFPFSFKISFQIHFSNIQTSIKQNPCIRIMMHKHLLFLNYYSDV
jgi:hypothetical protein